MPPALTLPHRTAILRTLPDGAGIDALRAAWIAFVSANPSAVCAPGAIYEPDFYGISGEGHAISPPPAPVTAEDYYRALRLSGGSEEDARQIADDFAPDVGRAGVFWVGDTLLYVALLSPEHEERIRDYLNLDSVRLTQALERVRGELAAHERRTSTNRDQAT